MTATLSIVYTAELLVADAVRSGVTEPREIPTASPQSKYRRFISKLLHLLKGNVSLLLIKLLLSMLSSSRCLVWESYCTVWTNSILKRATRGLTGLTLSFCQFFFLFTKGPVGEMEPKNSFLVTSARPCSTPHDSESCYTYLMPRQYQCSRLASLFHYRHQQLGQAQMTLASALGAGVNLITWANWNHSLCSIFTGV